MFAVLRKRNFTLLWLGQVVSLCGDGFLYIAVPYYVYQLTGSVLQTGITVIVETLPRVLLSSLAGVFVDRWNRRWTMLIADLLRAAVLLLMLLVHSADLLWLIYVALAAQAIISQFFTPASMALIPSLVEDEQLIAANSLSSLGQSVTRLVGPPIGGVLFTALGLTGAVLMDSVTYVFSALMLLLIVLPASASISKGGEQKERVVVAAAIKHLWEEWVGGLRLIGRSQTLTGILLTMGVLMLGQGIIQVMFVVFVRNVMHGDAMVYAWVLTSQGVGSMLGALLNGVISKWLRPVYQIALAGLTAGAAILVIIYYPQLVLVMILTGFMGVFVAGLVVTLYTLLQVGAEDRYRGRVFGTLETVMSLAMLISMTLSSSFGDRLGVVPWMTISGALVLLSGFVALLTLRQARLPQAEKRAVEKEMEPVL
ncbi:MAG: MFS transporter [Ktedonobacteraceae bacterium]|nr:MFS transporter [Ktedonobacteraceae bacterium]MBO0790408.1 MFS transporter [Ktedonobacteraceae bacterium]